MHRLACLTLGFLLACPGVAAAREPLGLYDNWGAFRDAAPARCYALAEPARSRRRGATIAAFAAVAIWPGHGVRGQLHIRLSRLKRRGAPMWLAIGGQRLLLASGNTDAWAPDTRADAAITGLMRSGSSMSVETVDANGHPFADTYRLRGAATAMDAAALACTGAG